ncbi:PAAR domain-containing protein [Paraburkholderia solitsugae]|uniref:PAAR domain-containing protein n=1 Tax=Paraburkholderia solitsugae TaxID=2675748 RepID=UPI001C12F019|nr:PAAR domain-containing protein [Paraburkholderia solitsugae]
MKDKDNKEVDYLFAIIDSLTEEGGRVTTATGDFALQSLGVAHVGDVVTSLDSNGAVITDGARFAVVIENRSAAFVGSSPSNGDRITQTLQVAHSLLVCDGERTPRLFDPACLPPLSTDTDGWHNHA